MLFFGPYNHLRWVKPITFTQVGLLDPEKINELQHIIKSSFLLAIFHFLHLMSHFCSYLGPITSVKQFNVSKLFSRPNSLISQKITCQFKKNVKLCRFKVQWFILAPSKWFNLAPKWGHGIHDHIWSSVYDQRFWLVPLKSYRLQLNHHLVHLLHSVHHLVHHLFSKQTYFWKD